MLKNHRIGTIELVIIGLITLSLSPHVLAQPQDVNGLEDLFELPIEQLMNIEITTASKTEEKLFNTAAAVYVITAEDIRRSGATSIMDALRMVPGLQVAQINANKWAISSRGFNSEFVDKMLVMIDGRSIYSPQWGGVRWNANDVMLEDIERIEVIRGPGGTLWGANAVNGIINIITKNAKETQGGLLIGGGGTEEGSGAVRYGGRIDNKTYFRVYSKYFSRDDGVRLTGDSGKDGWDVLRGGFRIDSDLTERDHWTLSGDIYDGNIERTGKIYSLTAPISQPYTHENTISGGHLFTRMKRTLSESSDVELKLYYNREKRLERILSETLDTYDIDFQHRFALNDSHEVIWGLGYRLYDHRLDGSFSYSLTPRHRDIDIETGFIQDKISLIEDQLHLILGTKLGHDHFCGYELQPSGRLLWTPDSRNTVWAAVTRAVKRPNRHERDSMTSWGVFQIGPSLISQESYGSDRVDCEEMVAYELGYRTRLTDRLLLDVTGFANAYDQIAATERIANITMPGYTIWPYQFGNNLDGETYGTEVSATYQATDNWKLNAGYTFLQMQIHPDGSNSTRDAVIEGDSPHNQFHLGSYLDLQDDLEFDMLLNYVDNVPSEDVSEYVRFDARLGWHIAKNMELSIVGQNLIDKRHLEFGSEAGQVPTEAERVFFVTLRYLF